MHGLRWYLKSKPLKAFEEKKKLEKSHCKATEPDFPKEASDCRLFISILLYIHIICLATLLYTELLWSLLFILHLFLKKYNSLVHINIFLLLLFLFFNCNLFND